MIIIKKISVIIPTRNRPGKIENCLKSLFAQTIPPNEIIVIDSSSSLKSSIVIKKLNKNIGIPIKFFYKKNYGSVRARNLGARLAQSGYLAFLDDDCIAPKDWLSQIFYSIHRFPNSVIYGGNIRLSTGNYYALAEDIRIQSGQKIYSNFDSKNFVLPKKIIKGNKLYFDTQFDNFSACEDTDFGIQLIKKGIKIVYFPKIAINHYGVNSFMKLIRREFEKARARFYLNLKYKNINDIKKWKFGSIKYFLEHKSTYTLNLIQFYVVLFLLICCSITYRSGILFEKFYFMISSLKKTDSNVFANSSAPSSVG